MVTMKQRRLIVWLVKLRIWKMKSDYLWGRAIFIPMWGTRWLLKRISRIKHGSGCTRARVPC